MPLERGSIAALKCGMRKLWVLVMALLANATLAGETKIEDGVVYYILSHQGLDGSASAISCSDYRQVYEGEQLAGLTDTLKDMYGTDAVMLCYAYAASGTVYIHPTDLDYVFAGVTYHVGPSDFYMVEGEPGRIRAPSGLTFFIALTEGFRGHTFSLWYENDSVPAILFDE